MEKSHNKKPFVNNFVLAIVSIIAIALIVIITNNYSPSNVASKDTFLEESDAIGQAFVPMDIQRTCKLSVSLTTLFDSQAMHVTLSEGQSAYYQGNTISLFETTNSGCVIGINSDEDFIAVGQVQKLGSTYILVTDVTQG